MLSEQYIPNHQTTKGIATGTCTNSYQLCCLISWAVQRLDTSRLEAKNSSQVLLQAWESLTSFPAGTYWDNDMALDIWTKAISCSLHRQHKHKSVSPLSCYLKYCYVCLDLIDITLVFQMLMANCSCFLKARIRYLTEGFLENRAWSGAFFKRLYLFLWAVVNLTPKILLSFACSPMWQ